MKVRPIVPRHGQQRILIVQLLAPSDDHASFVVAPRATVEGVAVIEIISFVWLEVAVVAGALTVTEHCAGALCCVADLHVRENGSVRGPADEAAHDTVT